MGTKVEIIKDGNIRNIPWDKHQCLNQTTLQGMETVLTGERVGGICPAINSGKVVLKCIINGVSPFMKAPREEHVLYFNDKTLNDKTLGTFPDSFRKMTETIPGLEGFTLRPIFNYRHNYLEFPTFIRTLSSFENILWTQPLSKSIPLKQYKDEQTFYVCGSLYTEKFLYPTGYGGLGMPQMGLSDECFSEAIWQYETLNVTNFYDIFDIELGSENYEMTNVYFPCQVAVDNCGTGGIHWGVKKKTSLFKGEDFFIEFRKHALSSNIPSLLKNKPMMIEEYQCLDSTIEFLEEKDEISGFQRFKNQALISIDPITKKNEEGEEKVIGQKVVDRITFDFTTQAYYIVEIGDDSYDDQHYFIIICQKSDPICIRKTGGFTWLISTFEGINELPEEKTKVGTISGKSLIEADYFTMVVRNYLGKFLIQFTGPGFKSSPWVIERNDSYVNITKTKTMFVPPTSISIFGGNILSGFIFSPLQYYPIYYEGDYRAVKFRFPPEIKKGVYEEVDQDFALYYDASAHNVLFSSSDEYIDSILQNRSFGNQSLRGQKIYTQDAIEFFESKDGKYIKSYGNFFGEDSLRDKKYEKYKKNKNGSLELIGYSSAIIKKIKKMKNSILGVKKIDTKIDEGRRRQVFFLDVNMAPGDHLFYRPELEKIIEEGEDQVSHWVLNHCKPPIMTMIRLVSVENEEPRWIGESLDATDHIMSFTESWSASDFSKIEHTGNIKFLLNEGMNIGSNITDRLLSLRDKNFYIEIWGGYENELTNLEERLIGGEINYLKTCNYSQIPGLYKLFTGMCGGGTIERSYGQRTMTCKIDDYNKALKDQRFFNCPFWDGVKDVNAMNELLNMAGFRSNLIVSNLIFNSGTVASVNNYGPRLLIRNLASFQGNGIVNLISPDGRSSITQSYALPSAYFKLQQPYFRSKDGDKMYDMVVKICERAGKLFYFDQFGVAHMENFLDQFQNIVMGGANDEIPAFFYTTNPDVWMGQLIFNNMSFQHDVNSTYNHIKLMANTPNHELLFLDDLNWESFDNPDTEGFIGYLKTFFQREGVIGSEEASMNIIDFYKRTMFRPPLVVNFESYGQPVRALDLIVLNNVPLRVNKVDTTMDPSKNVWWQRIEGEWCQWTNPVPSENLLTRNT